jgi:hypothetical protein
MLPPAGLAASGLAQAPATPKTQFVDSVAIHLHVGCEFVKRAFVGLHAIGGAAHHV